MEQISFFPARSIIDSIEIKEKQNRLGYVMTTNFRNIKLSRSAILVGVDRNFKTHEVFCGWIDHHFEVSNDSLLPLKTLKMMQSRHLGSMNNFMSRTSILYFTYSQNFKSLFQNISNLEGRRDYLLTHSNQNVKLKEYQIVSYMNKCKIILIKKFFFSFSYFFSKGFFLRFRLYHWIISFS